MLKQYVRDKNLRKVGLMVGEIDKSDKIVYLGVSYCHPNDTFDKRIAHEIAIGRMEAKMEEFEVPYKYEKQYDSFVNRLSKYYHVEFD